uniref:Uncharacterized protein n=1 Tax=Glossina pallidipes TaxID=7398 RepID=A0A1B0A738_GLOPL
MKCVYSSNDYVNSAGGGGEVARWRRLVYYVHLCAFRIILLTAACLSSLCCRHHQSMRSETPFKNKIRIKYLHYYTDEILTLSIDNLSTFSFDCHLLLQCSLNC